MLTEPVGPRSPDDILTVVYQRTERARRRRRQQLGAAVAIVAFGVAGLVSLFPGDDEAARVRVVDGPNPRTEEASDVSATPTTAVASDAEQTATSPTTTATTKRRPQPSGDGGNQASAPTTPPLPTTTTLPATPGGGPSVKLLAEEGDRSNDSIPSSWYYDITKTAMQLDQRNDVVVFTTRYRGPDSSGARDRRTLRSEFDYENDPVVVDVTETDNALGTVAFGGTTCSACTADFDDVRAELTVTVPVSTVNAYLVAHHGNGASIERAVISALHAYTAPFGVNDVPADESGDTG